MGVNKHFFEILLDFLMYYLRNIIIIKKIKVPLYLIKIGQYHNTTFKVHANTNILE